MKDRVIFRKWKDTGDVIALFPHLPANAGTITTYQHVGQHYDHVYPDIIQLTDPAYYPETEDLKQELLSIGYDVQVGDRVSKPARRMRSASEYRKNAGACPYCLSLRIEGQSVEINDGQATQDVYCHDCGMEYTDMYVLKDYEVTVLPNDFVDKHREEQVNA